MLYLLLLEPKYSYRVTAGPLFVVVDEDVVPGEGAHVECVQRAEHPKEGEEEERDDEDVQPSVQTATALVLFLLLNLFLNLCKAVSVHLQLNVEDLALVLPPLDSSGDGEEAGRVLDEEALLISALQGALLVHCHVHAGSPDALVTNVVRAKNLDGFVICVDPSRNANIIQSDTRKKLKGSYLI